MQLTMLGTGHALVRECYNTCFVIEDNKKYFMVDGGGGNAVLRQLQSAGFDWMDMHEIFVTHKHIDHIYGHEEVISLIWDMAEKLLWPKQTQFIGVRLHLITVNDGEERVINGKTVTFFDICSTKAKQFGFCMELDNGKKMTCCGDGPYNPCEEKYVKGCEWLLHEAFCLDSQADRSD